MEKSGLLVLFLFHWNIYCKRQLRNKEAKRLNLITKQSSYEPVYGREVKQLTLDRDFNVPDARPGCVTDNERTGRGTDRGSSYDGGKGKCKRTFAFPDFICIGWGYPGE